METPESLGNSDSSKLTFGEFNLQMGSCFGQLMLLDIVEARSWILKS